jgi:hypothetical protein
VADDHRLLLAQRLHQSDVVEHLLRHPVGLDGRRFRRAPVASNIDRDRTIASLGQSRELMPIGIPRLRKPVHQQDQRAVAGLDAVDPNAVHLLDAVCQVVPILQVSLIVQVVPVAQVVPML